MPTNLSNFLSSNFQGSQGAQGVQSVQGIQGPQGTQSSQGLQGTQGTQGLSNQGAQGSQSIQGTQGPQGLQGLSNQGAQGTQSSQGVQGPQGLQGLSNQGAQGTQSSQGPQGPQGLQATQGLQGLQGISGQNPGFNYTYSNTVTAADPGSGFFRFNSLTTGSITEMYISDIDNTGTDRSTPLLTLDDTPGSDRARIYIPGASSGFQISITVTGAITDNGTWLTIPVSFTSGALPTNNEVRTVLGVRNGIQGAQGLQGASGPVSGSANQIVYKDGTNTATGSANLTYDGNTFQVTPTASSTGALFSGSTSTDLVRITQTGSGNAFVVEDSTNPDSTRFVIDANGDVGIATNSVSAY